MVYSVVLFFKGGIYYIIYFILYISVFIICKFWCVVFSYTLLGIIVVVFNKDNTSLLFEEV